MKVIDLYDMVAKGEQPKKFKYKDKWFAYSVDDKEFRALKQEVFDGDYLNYVYLSDFIDLSNLNDEIEIIEDEPKKIEKLEIDDDWELERYYLDLKGLNRNLIKVIKKQNEIINYINSKEDK